MYSCFQLSSARIEGFPTNGTHPKLVVSTNVYSQLTHSKSFKSSIKIYLFPTGVNLGSNTIESNIYIKWLCH